MILLIIFLVLVILFVVVPIAVCAVSANSQKRSVEANNKPIIAKQLALQTHLNTLPDYSWLSTCPVIALHNGAELGYGEVNYVDSYTYTSYFVGSYKKLTTANHLAMHIGVKDNVLYFLPTAANCCANPSKIKPYKIALEDIDYYENRLLEVKGGKTAFYFREDGRGKALTLNYNDFDTLKCVIPDQEFRSKSIGR